MSLNENRGRQRHCYFWSIHSCCVCVFYIYFFTLFQSAPIFPHLSTKPITLLPTETSPLVLLASNAMCMREKSRDWEENISTEAGQTFGEKALEYRRKKRLCASLRGERYQFSRPPETLSQYAAPLYTSMVDSRPWSPTIEWVVWWPARSSTVLGISRDQEQPKLEPPCWKTTSVQSSNQNQIKQQNVCCWG